NKPFYHACGIRKRQLSSLLAVLDHHSSTHNIAARRSSMVKRKHLETNVYDPVTIVKHMK
ncbi:hypothetical protein HMPREF1544_07823, partial [Mucor circinelloides 1006PhL]